MAAADMLGHGGHCAVTHTAAKSPRQCRTSFGVLPQQAKWSGPGWRCKCHRARPSLSNTEAKRVNYESRRLRSLARPFCSAFPC
jgi:hypothetical protein